MRFFTPEETHQWCASQGIELVDDFRLKTTYAPENCLHVSLLNDVTRIVWFSNFIERTLTPRERCMLWVTRDGVWPTSENSHLYYRVRESYGDHRLLEEAPGHLFLEHERADLATFIELGIISGWDMYLLPTFGYGRVFICHDEWIEFGMDNPKEIESIKGDLTKAGCRVLDWNGRLCV